ncbi:MAG: hypothetical protein NZL89_00550 [Leptospiraceae bacterium]|nr:hypothetical protein [Leptospiraceae bacterium]
MKTKNLHTTSVSLPENVAEHWQKHQREIMRFAARFLRLKMRNPIRRGVTRSYNDAEGPYRIVTTRFTPEEHDALLCVASALRVSVSSLVYGLILLWLKPARRALRRFFAINYYQEASRWDPVAGYLIEKLFFWHWREGEKPPWQDIPEDLHEYMPFAG